MMSENLKQISIVCVAVIVGLLVLGLTIRSCGTEAEVTCPGGGSAKVIERGNLGGGSYEGVCAEIEDRN